MGKKHYLSPEERMMVVNAHAYFLEQSSKRGTGKTLGVRKQVALCLQISESTVDRILSSYNKNSEAFARPPSPVNRGTPPLSYPEEVVTYVRNYVTEKNLKSEPCSVPTLKKRLKDEKGIDIPARTLHRILHRAGFFFGSGKKRNVLAESNGTRALRSKYLRIKTSFRNSNRAPSVPEVYLDESYCNLNHTSNQTWL
jgi:transposase